MKSANYQFQYLLMLAGLAMGMSAWFSWCIRWRPYALFFVIVVLAILVRGYELGQSVLSWDECFSWRLTGYPASDLIRRTALDVHPPLYYLLLKPWLSLWGISPLALRGFSAFWGILGVGMIYLLSLEGFFLNGVRKISTAKKASLFCAFLFAIHIAQVVPAGTARMYSFGVFLAVLTAWLLLRALRSTHASFLWWSAYGLAVAAFCYTHYFAFFTIVAQAIYFAGHFLYRARTAPFRDILPAGRGFLYAMVLALLVYLPWIRIFLSQMHVVRNDYWISGLNANELASMFFSWAAGIESPGFFITWIGIGIIALTFIWLAKNGGGQAFFFMLQAFVPWFLVLAFSAFTARPILLERCMVFAQISLICLFGLAWYRLSIGPERSLMVCLLGTMCALGTWERENSLPDTPPAVEVAAQFLKNHYNVGDVVEVEDGIVGVNRLRFYAVYAGLDNINVRTRFNSLAGKGIHIYHGASLAPTDVLTKSELSSQGNARWWRAGEGLPLLPPIGMKVALKRTFHGGGGSHFTLIMFAKE